MIAAIAVMVTGAYAYRWVADDAMIDFRIVENLLHGHGPVYNVGERVEVYSNPLWVVLLALVRPVLFFLPFGTISVFLGLTLSATAVILTWRAMASTPTSRTEGRLPAGLMLFCCLPATWEFVTSGLETSLSFFWVGLSVSCLTRRRQSPVTSLVIGCAPLVRPDLAVVALFLGSFQLMHLRSATTRYAAMRSIAVLLAPMVIYEFFRVAYFGLLVSNTALVKSATSLRWGVGWSYLTDFVGPYFLAAPLVVLLVWWIANLRGESRSGNWRDDVRLPLFLGGSVNAAYIVAIGGDFMHARLLLPSFFAIMAAFTVRPPRQGRRLVTVISATYLFVLIVGLRYSPASLSGYVMVSDERLMQMSLTHRDHPVNETDMVDSIWWRYGARLRTLAESHRGSAADFVVGSSPTALTGPVNFPLLVVPTSAAVATPVVAASRTLGQVGLAAGRTVTVFDVLSLANPVSSHFALSHRTLRAGHEKEAALSWYVARYGSERTVGLMNYYAGFFQYPVMTRDDVRAASDAMSCGSLRWYLASIHAPLSVRQMMSNARHAVEWTTLSFPAQPTAARALLCAARH